MLKSLSGAWLWSRALVVLCTEYLSWRMIIPVQGTICDRLLVNNSSNGTVSHFFLFFHFFFCLFHLPSVSLGPLWRVEKRTLEEQLTACPHTGGMIVWWLIFNHVHLQGYEYKHPLTCFFQDLKNNLKIPQRSFVLVLKFHYFRLKKQGPRENENCNMFGTNWNIKSKTRWCSDIISFRNCGD